MNTVRTKQFDFDVSDYDNSAWMWLYNFCIFRKSDNCSREGLLASSFKRAREDSFNNHTMMIFCIIRIPNLRRRPPGDTIFLRTSMSPDQFQQWCIPRWRFIFISNSEPKKEKKNFNHVCFRSRNNDLANLIFTDLSRGPCCDLRFSGFRNCFSFQLAYDL